MSKRTITPRQESRDRTKNYLQQEEKRMQGPLAHKTSFTSLLRNLDSRTCTVSSYEKAGSFFIFFSKKLIASCSFNPALVACKSYSLGELTSWKISSKTSKVTQTQGQQIPSKAQGKQLFFAIFRQEYSNFIVLVWMYGVHTTIVPPQSSVNNLKLQYR